MSLKNKKKDRKHTLELKKKGVQSLFTNLFNFIVSFLQQIG